MTTRAHATTTIETRGRMTLLFGVMAVTILILGVLGPARAQETGLVHEFSVEPGVDGQPEFSSPHHVAASPDGRHVYVTTFPSPLGVSLLTFERTADDLELLETRFSGDGGVGFFPQGLAITSDGAYVLLPSFSPAVLQVFERDTATGLLTHVQTVSHSDLNTVDGVTTGGDLTVIWGRTSESEGLAVELHQVLDASGGVTQKNGPEPFETGDSIPSRDPWDIISKTPGVVGDRINVGGNESWAGRTDEGDLLFRSELGDCSVPQEETDVWATDGVVITDIHAVAPSPSTFVLDAMAPSEFAVFSIENTGGEECEAELQGVDQVPFPPFPVEEIGPDFEQVPCDPCPGPGSLFWIYPFDEGPDLTQGSAYFLRSTEEHELMFGGSDRFSPSSGRSLDMGSSGPLPFPLPGPSVADRSSDDRQQWQVYATVPDPASIHAFRLIPEQEASDGPPPPDGAWLEDPDLPGFRTKVRISAGDTVITGQRVEPCIGETICVAGALPDRAEVFVRVVGPKPNDKLWPTLVKFSTSRAEVWIEQTATGEIQYYDLAPVAPGQQILTLDGLADKEGFDPATAAAAVFERLSGLVQGGGPAVLVTRDDPDPPIGAWIEDPDLPGFRTKVRISAGDTVITGQRVEPCIGETICVAGALPDRAEVFVRVVGPKPNGKLWPTLVKFSTSRVEVWIEQTSTGEVQYYDLAKVAPGQRFLTLEGLADKQGFDP